MHVHGFIIGSADHINAPLIKRSTEHIKVPLIKLNRQLITLKCALIKLKWPLIIFLTGQNGNVLIIASTDHIKMSTDYLKIFSENK